MAILCLKYQTFKQVSEPIPSPAMSAAAAATSLVEHLCQEVKVIFQNSS